MNLFRNRVEAGRKLARALEPLRGQPGVTVIGLPRGGVPVAAEVARSLGAPLDIFVVRKVGVPGQRELAMGAVARGVRVIDDELVREIGLPPESIEEIVAEELAEVERREVGLRAGRPPASLTGRTVVIVDDGLATGSTMRAAVRAIRRQRPARLVAAVPVGAEPSCLSLQSEVDELVCLEMPEPFQAVSLWYDEFNQVSDDEVRAILAGYTTTTRRAVRIPVGGVELEGTLSIPPDAAGLVVFAHGSGSSRFSPRNQFVANTLETQGFATLLFDLLTPEEEESERWTRHLRFDLELLAGRLVAVIDWLAEGAEFPDRPIGLFGASTGAGAALIAAARRPDAVRAVVSRGGRPDLAGPSLARVRAPTLLIVGGDDEEVIALNQQALEELKSETRLTIVPGATHLFEEPGTLEEVARLAGQWFHTHLVERGAPLSQTRPEQPRP